MKKLLLLALCALPAFAQGSAWSASASASTTAAGEINQKMAMQYASGAPSALNCTVGHDQYTNSANGDLYNCSVTGAPGTWVKVNTGAAGPTGAQGPTGTSGSGTGTINSGTVGQVAEYTTTGTTVGPVGPGTTTTVLHGNASGSGAFGAVVLTTDVSGVLPAANVAAALSSTTSVNGTTIPSGGVTLTQTIAAGSQALGVVSIAANACATAIAVTASGVASTDRIVWTPNADVSGQTGYSFTSTDGLRVYAWPTSGNVNFHVCNGTASAITPGAVTLNYGVTR